jgi:hypothetical protein
MEDIENIEAWNSSAGLLLLDSDDDKCVTLEL